MLTPEEKAFAAVRSHEDAKAANALFQAAGQAVILINGGAASGLLTFGTNAKAVDLLGSGSLARSILYFAAGVVSGSLVIIFQAYSIQKHMVSWEGEALLYGQNVIKRSANVGKWLGRIVKLLLFLSTIFFAIGALSISLSLNQAK